MAPKTITLSPEQRADILTAALSLYSVKADALHEALDGYLEDHQSLEELEHHRSEIAALERLLNQLGWDFAADRSIELALPSDRGLLFELIYDAYGQAIENLAVAIGRPPGGFDIEQARRRLRYACSLLGVVAAASPGTHHSVRRQTG